MNLCSPEGQSIAVLNSVFDSAVVDGDVSKASTVLTNPDR